VIPSEENMHQFVDYACHIERTFGLHLQYLSGGPPTGFAPGAAPWLYHPARALPGYVAPGGAGDDRWGFCASVLRYRVSHQGGHPVEEGLDPIASHVYPRRKRRGSVERVLRQGHCLTWPLGKTPPQRRQNVPQPDGNAHRPSQAPPRDGADDMAAYQARAGTFSSSASVPRQAV
jgi:hypothetical protein